MRRLKKPLELVASGEYDGEMGYILLDNKIEENKIYLVSIIVDGYDIINLILPTITNNVNRINTKYFNVLVSYSGNTSYAYVANNELNKISCEEIPFPRNTICYVYELDI